MTAAPKASSNLSPTLPSYKKPPISEVAVGLFFEPIDGFLLPPTGHFWRLLQDDYSTDEQTLPPSQPGALNARQDTTGFPLPRISLKSKDNRRLLQLQGNCLFYSWRRGNDGDEYPRYPAIIEKFEKHLSLFLELLRKNGLVEPKLVACELAYINHIPQGKAWNSTEDLRHILRDFCWSSEPLRFFPIPASVSWSSTFTLPDDAGQLTTKLSQVRRLTEQPPSLQLELTARGLGKSTNVSRLRPWFDLAREWIVLGFTDLTTTEAQKSLWEREDV